MGTVFMLGLLGVVVLLGWLAEKAEERSFLLWALFYLASGCLGIMIISFVNSDAVLPPSLR